MEKDINSMNIGEEYEWKPIKKKLPNGCIPWIVMIILLATFYIYLYNAEG